MNTYISVPIATKQFLALVDFLKAQDDPRDPVDIISLAIDYWVDYASWKPELLEESDSYGYQWKTLFLPSGTQLRMQYKGRYHYAKVVGDEMIYEGVATSPGGMANTIAGSNRNAWRDMWIKRPNESEWTLADDCRRRDIEEAEIRLKEATASLKEALKNVGPDFNPND